jgi:hypothetical protein
VAGFVLVALLSVTAAPPLGALVQRPSCPDHHALTVTALANLAQFRRTASYEGAQLAGAAPDAAPQRCCVPGCS